MAEWQFDPQQQSGRMIFDETLTVVDVAAAKAQLVAASEEADEVVVDLRALSAIDVAGLQLLCAFHRFAAGRRRRMLLRVGDNPVFWRMVEAAGLSRNIACDAEDSETCVWVGHDRQ